MDMMYCCFTFVFLSMHVLASSHQDFGHLMNLQLYKKVVGLLKGKGNQMKKARKMKSLPLDETLRSDHFS